MRVYYLFFFSAVLLLTPATSQALTLKGESRTYVQAYEPADSKRLIPVYEYLDMTIRDVGSENVSFHFGGWLRGKDDPDIGFSKRFNGDLQYAYLSYVRKQLNQRLNMGRIFVSEGVALEQVDGIYARTDLGAGFGISAFGGIPVETDFDKRGGDTILGGRVTHEMKGTYRIGASYLKEKNDSAKFREEAGADLLLMPFKKTVLTGRSSYNIETSGWMEHAYAILLGPFNKLRLTGDLSWVDYEDYFTSYTTSAFNFLLTSIDPKEKVFRIGGEASYVITDSITAALMYRNYNYDKAGSAAYYGARLRYSVPQSGGAGISAHRMDGDTDRLKYTELKAYGYKKFGKLDVTLSLLDVVYDEKINGVKNAYAIMAASGYDLSKKVRIAADVEYGHNPFYDEEVKALFKIIYRFDTGRVRKGV